MASLPQGLALVISLLATLACTARASAQACSPCDWDASGTLAAADTCLFMSQWTHDAAVGHGVTDFDHNGVVNAADVDAFMTCVHFPFDETECPTLPQRPANDDCSNAIRLPDDGGTFDLTPLFFATPGAFDSPLCEPAAPGVRRDAWYRWTAPTDGDATVSTVNLAQWDTRIAVFRGCPCPALANEMDWCNDTFSGLAQAEVTFPVVAGETYLLAIGGLLDPLPEGDCAAIGPANLGAGQFALAFIPVNPPPVRACALCDFDKDGDVDCPDGHLFIAAFWDDLANGTTNADVNRSCNTDQVDWKDFFDCWMFPPAACLTGPAPRNDSCDNPTILARTTTSFNADNCRAALPEAADQFIYFDIWFSWTPECPGEYTLSTVGQTALDTKIAVYLDSDEAPCGDPGRRLASNDDAGPATKQSETSFNAAAGSRYLFQIGLSPDIRNRLALFGGDINVLLTRTRTDNDTCATNRLFALTEVWADLGQATTAGPNHPWCTEDATGVFHRDVWYHFRADLDAPKVYSLTLLSLSQTPVQARVAVYCSPPNECDVQDRLVACGEGFADGTTPRVTWQSFPGRNYFVRLGAIEADASICVGARLSAAAAPLAPPPPPGGPEPLREELYRIDGDGRGLGWAFSVQGANYALYFPNIPGVPIGSGPTAIASRFVEHINAAQRPTITAELSRRVKGQYIIRSTATQRPQIWVGTSGEPTFCGGPFRTGACPFNPDLLEVPLPGIDANNNGRDDLLDIATGTSLDIDGNGVPDESQKLVCPDWNRDGTVNSTDVSDFINDWFSDQAEGGLTTEINGDGASNSTDVSDYINLWFASPPECST